MFIIKHWLTVLSNSLCAWHAPCKFAGMPLATHLLLFRDHTRVFLTLAVALAAVLTCLASLAALAA